MMFPTIHLNGTSPEDLLERLEKASRAVSAAMDALQAAAPHGRDYYPQGAEAFPAAQCEHIERQRALGKVYDDMEKLAWHVQDAIDTKKKSREGR